MMNHNPDVLVIGGGLSGLMAAAKAVEGGKKVLLAAKGAGVLSLSSGCIDLWGYSFENPKKLCQYPLEEVKRLTAAAPDHPYAKVEELLIESLQFFQKICRENNLPYLNNNNENWLLPTALGTLRPTYLAPAGMAVNFAEHKGNLVIVGFNELKDFFPELAATRLRKNAVISKNCEISTVLVGLGKGELNPSHLAHRLEKPKVLDRVIAQLKPLVRQESLLLFPPVLGDQNYLQVLERISNCLGCQAIEITGLPPSMPGQRLQRTLYRHLKSKGVKIIQGCTITGAKIHQGLCTEVTAAAGGKTLHLTASVFILATGSFLGGGLVAEPGAIQEIIFNLPVKYEKKWSDPNFLSFNGHPFSRFGITVNNRLQPVAADGKVLIKNLMVAGSNLAGCNYSIEKCGNGVAVATGYKAGKLSGGLCL